MIDEEKNSNEEVKLQVEPKPDKMIRVFVTFKEINSTTKVKEQQLKTNERNGFTVVEWGGSFLK